LTHLILGRVFEKSNRASLAERAYRDALWQQEKIEAKYPVHPDSWHHLARCRVNLGEVLHVQGRSAEAEKVLRAAEDGFRNGLAALPDYADANNEFAWLLVNCPLKQFRDVKRALPLAEKAVVAQPKRGSFYTTLGTAHYRNGNWNDALKALTKAAELDQSSAAARFVLAMTHWQLRASDEARREFDRAAVLAAENNTLATCRFHAEAAALLGIQP
jgi:tetratricopeptide (TPR) repeat protein